MPPPPDVLVELLEDELDASAPPLPIPPAPLVAPDDEDVVWVDAPTSSSAVPVAQAAKHIATPTQPTQARPHRILSAYCIETHRGKSSAGSTAAARQGSGR